MKNSIMDSIERRLENNSVITLSIMWGITGVIVFTILKITGVI
jgi:hypothetical protein|tara:strand:- start:109 stop:237 length:129 start_codon:yes stop_codon:yes gene_type:complete